MELTCIMCPVGCSLTVLKNGKNIDVTGNGCPRGEIYGKNEITCPKRTVTTIKQYKNGTISLKTSTPIKKELIEKCLKEIKKFKITKNIKVGDVLISKILNTDVDIIITNINN